LAGKIGFVQEGIKGEEKKAKGSIFLRIFEDFTKSI
jgi:hypothetical protein